MSHTTVSSLVEADTLSSASYPVSPKSPERGITAAPGSAPHSKVHEAATSCNGLDQIDNRIGDDNRNYEDTVKQNGTVVDVHIVSESSHSIDVLSGGESDPGDTLSRSHHNNYSISSYGLGTLRDGTTERGRRRVPSDQLYFITKELLMTERTYKTDLEIVTVWWSQLVSELMGAGGVREDALEALGRPCLALEPIALAQATFLAHLERALAAPQRADSVEDPEYRRLAELLYDYLKNTYDMYWSYISRAGALVARLESARRGGGVCATAACTELETRSPLPLAFHLLRPLHRLLHLAHVTKELQACGDSEGAGEAHELSSRLAEAAASQLRHTENHALLCHLQRDITGFEKLLTAEREFVRLGCLYKHSSKGLQQRMIFLFSDVLVCCSKSAVSSSSSQQFRVHSVLPLCALGVAPAQHYNSFLLHGENVALTLSAGSAEECEGWRAELRESIARARQRAPPDAAVAAGVLAPDVPDAPEALPGAALGGGGLAHVCWHRGTSLTRDQYHLAMKMQMSGYLLRKFKNSHGWQKLWVVLAASTLFFYKSWSEEQPLASLPLLGYNVTTPNKSDAIHKEYVFKLLFKNHIYFFRAESEYTFRRWTEVLRASIGHPSHS